MTCRFEEESAGKQYPRSCPTCGLSGSCTKGYHLDKLPLGGYVIVRPDGTVYKPPQFGGAIPEKPAPLATPDTAPRTERIKQETERMYAEAAAAKRRLSRVTRARIADIIEAAAQGGLTDETSINYYVGQITL